MHAKHEGVLSIKSEFEVHDKQDLGELYTPGVAVLSRMLEKNPDLRYRYTMSGKLVALITDGSAVLGLGDIGPRAGLPVVEGKALLYKDMADVDAIPLAVQQVPVDDFVDTVTNISHSFAGIHLEDIAAPRCFEIVEKLSARLDIPVYHDDQEGTAIVILAALINAAKVVGKDLSGLRVLINGAGASGIATARLLRAYGITDLILVDVHGCVTAGDDTYNAYQRAMAGSGRGLRPGAPLHEAIQGCDVFVGLSVADVLTPEDVASMADDPIVFALANPKPEIDPRLVPGTKIAVFATGSSQYANQVNNVLAYPGLFKGLLDSGLKRVTPALEEAVAIGLAGLVESPKADRVIPGVFDPGVVDVVSQAVLDYVEKGNKQKEREA